ncbi:hypothetical protein SeMB42_g05236 [Synchytrium endobioticum]|uniref:Mif2/CENP-C cupin domain-containing protein n=1 Tax=Synchytrium endobioticum TaxID=286115 RepID=A0A507CSX5_9FUNG|nr:hypothetical protein SeMB42_g05236 [Synchytrium endobioticum]TPX42754.1 hypothetical protein SeLEV6574_g05425 [Synchytrium endobioticum]
MVITEKIPPNAVNSASASLLSDMPKVQYTKALRPNKFFAPGVGKKTGIRAKENVKLDDDGLDNLEDFYHSDEEIHHVPTMPVVVKNTRYHQERLAPPCVDSGIHMEFDQTHRLEAVMSRTPNVSSSASSVLVKATSVKPPRFSEFDDAHDPQEDDDSKLDDVEIDVQPMRSVMAAQLPQYSSKRASIRPTIDGGTDNPFYNPIHAAATPYKPPSPSPPPHVRPDRESLAAASYADLRRSLDRRSARPPPHTPTIKTALPPQQEETPSVKDTPIRRNTSIGKSSPASAESSGTTPSITPLPRLSAISYKSRTVNYTTTTPDSSAKKSSRLSASIIPDARPSMSSTPVSPAKRGRQGTDETSDESDSDFVPVVERERESIGSRRNSKRRILEESEQSGDDDTNESSMAQEVGHENHEEELDDYVNHNGTVPLEYGTRHAEQDEQLSSEKSCPDRVGEEREKDQEEGLNRVVTTTEDNRVAKGKGRDNSVRSPKTISPPNTRSKTKSSSVSPPKSSVTTAAPRRPSSGSSNKRKNKEVKSKTLDPAIKQEFVPNEKDGLLIDGEGKRRSNRNRYAPLDWWRNEHVVYGRRKSGYCPVPVIQEIVRVPKIEEDAMPKRRYHGRAKRSVSGDEDGPGEEEVQAKPKPKTKSNMGKSKPVHARVYDVLEDQEKETMVGVNPEALEPLPVKNAKFLFRKLFAEGQFMAAGLLVLPPGADKPQKNAANSSMVFTVTDGTVEVLLQGTRFEVTAGGVFFIPRENDYTLLNKSQEDVRMSFVHCTEVVVGLPTSNEEQPAVGASSQQQPSPKQRQTPQRQQDEGRQSLNIRKEQPKSSSHINSSSKNISGNISRKKK